MADDNKKAKKKAKTPADLEDEFKTDLFNRMVLGKGKPSSGKPESPFDEMRKFMRDPFGTEDWAKSKTMKKGSSAPQPKPKKPNPELVTFDLLGMNPDEVAKAQENGQMAGWSFADAEEPAKVAETTE